MSETPTQTLLEAIRAKHEAVNAYLHTAGARQRRLVTVGIIASAVAATLTAAPALGGKTLSDWLVEVTQMKTPAWQLLCGVAALCSLTTVIVTQMAKSHGLEEHLAKAHDQKARLEWLEISLSTGMIGDAEAAAELRTSLDALSFLDEHDVGHPTPPAAPASG
jgi:hypothetical protein